MQCTGNSGCFLRGKRADIVRRYPDFILTLCSASVFPLSTELRHGLWILSEQTSIVYHVSTKPTRWDFLWSAKIVFQIGTEQKKARKAEFVLSFRKGGLPGLLNKIINC